MKTNNRACPSLEVLESRWCPAVTARVVLGNLLVSGFATNAGDTIQITQTAANAFEVKDGNTVVGNFTGVTRDVLINLGSANDIVGINLGGFATPRNVAVNLGGGNNRLSVAGAGTMSGDLSVLGGRGTDTVVFGDSSNALQFNRDIAINLNGDGGDTLTLSNRVTVRGWLAATFVNNVTLAAGSVVEKDVAILGGAAGNTVVASGQINGNFGFTGSHNIDRIALSGSVGRNVAITTFGEADTVAVGGTVAGHLLVNSGVGNDALTISATIGRTTTVFAEAGDDTLTMTADARFQGNAVISMGAGADRVTLDALASIVQMLIHGGPGIDTFVGNPNTTGLTLISFEA